MPDEGRRSHAAHQAILRSCVDLIRHHGPGAVTIEGVARAAGVGKQTIYRWWPSRGALLIDAMVTGRAQVELDLPDTGDLSADLAVVLTAVVRVLTGPHGPLLAAVLGEMQHDQSLRDAFDQAIFEPVRGRYRERLTTAREHQEHTGHWPDDDTILDMAFGPLWFRLLTRPEHLTEHFALDIAHSVARALA